jgi:hypothetical protein
MTPGQKFCTECGAALAAGTKFCGRCGHPVSVGAEIPALDQAPVPLQQPASLEKTSVEQITGIVPFIEQGLLSVSHYTLIVTTGRLIFCLWNGSIDEAMSGAEDQVMQESCSIAETAEEIIHFRKKDWATGPWDRYRAMTPDTIVAGAPGSLVIPMNGITVVDIVCETKSSTQDQLHILQGDKNQVFDLMYSQGPFLFRILQPILGERVRMADHLHERTKLDRLLTGQEYK